MNPLLNILLHIVVSLTDITPIVYIHKTVMTHFRIVICAVTT